jgi:hypothetical protein
MRRLLAALTVCYRSCIRWHSRFLLSRGDGHAGPRNTNRLRHPHRQEVSPRLPLPRTRQNRLQPERWGGEGVHGPQGVSPARVTVTKPRPAS